MSLALSETLKTGFVASRPNTEKGNVKKCSFSTPDRRQYKTLIRLSTNVDKKMSNVEFSIAICHPTGDKWQSHTLFLAIFDQRLLYVRAFSIAAYPVCSEVHNLS